MYFYAVDVNNMMVVVHTLYNLHKITFTMHKLALSAMDLSQPS